jgi:riboflavin kinase/FMN adenylyltransferase
MKYIISENTEITLNEESVVAIGNFDGVHLAHQRLIKEAIDFATRSRMQSVVLTFRPHTAHLFDRFGSPHLIMSYEEKIEEIGRLGVDIIIEQRFDEIFANLSREEFLSGYMRQLQTRAIFIGFDFKFGRDGTSNTEHLLEFGRKTGVFIYVLKPQSLLGTTISSTKIRNLLMEGNIELANQFLGRRYYISGSVIPGKMLGRSLGFPTANIPIVNRLSPREGVYLTNTIIEGMRYKSVSNVGRTSHNKEITLLETHILDFDGELYDKRVRVEFIKFLRPEIRFSSMEELVSTIKKDINTARMIFGEMSESN